MHDRTLAVTVPANTTATVYLPCADAASDAEGVKFLGTEAEQSLFEIGAGEYLFAMPWAK